MATTKLLPALLTCTLLGLATIGCGGGNPGPSASSASSEVTAAKLKSVTIITTSVIPPGQALRGDGDADNPSDIDGNGDLDHTDQDNDYPTVESYKFPDEDDKVILAYGHSARVLEERSIVGIVKRYYAAAATDDGARACALLAPDFAKSVVEDYGHGSVGPSYLRNGTTCQTVLSLLFEHFHEELTAAITVFDVRVSGNQARVVLSSRTLRASDISLQREGGSWKIVQLLGTPLG